MSQYSETIRQWAADTRRAGILQKADGTGEVGLDGANSGSRIAARFTLKVELNRIADIRYQVFGCGFSMAACAVAADMSIGYTLQELPKINADRINEALDGLPEDRLYCADLAAEALNAAVLSAQRGHKPISSSIKGDQDDHTLVKKDDPVYKLCMDSNLADMTYKEDRHLFACLLTVALNEPYKTHEALGLAKSDLTALTKRYFPGISCNELQSNAETCELPPPEVNDEVLDLLLEYRPVTHNQHDLQVSTWLCYIIAARAAHTGHLWVSMGLFERPELTASIQRHLPDLVRANNQNMRWKRFLFKQVCDRNGGNMCKTPNCGECSDYILCFADDE